MTEHAELVHLDLTYLQGLTTEITFVSIYHPVYTRVTCIRMQASGEESTQLEGCGQRTRGGTCFICKSLHYIWCGLAPNEEDVPS